MLTSEDIAILARPFPLEAHEFNKRGFCYVAEEEVTARLEEVDPSWSFEIQSIKRDGIGNQQCIVTARMTVSGVVRESTGMQMVEYSNDSGGGKSDREAGEPEKAATTDALRRCARLFGIGRYILKMGDAVKNAGQLEGWLKKNYPPAPAAPKAPPPQSTTTNGNGTTPPPAVLMHWSKDAVKMNWLIGDCVDKGFLEPGQTEKDLLELIEREDFLDFPTCKEHAVQAIAAHVKARYDLAELKNGNTTPPAKVYDITVKNVLMIDDDTLKITTPHGDVKFSREWLIEKLVKGDIKDRHPGQQWIKKYAPETWTAAAGGTMHYCPDITIKYLVEGSKLDIMSVWVLVKNDPALKSAPVATTLVNGAAVASPEPPW